MGDAGAVLGPFPMRDYASIVYTIDEELKVLMRVLLGVTCQTLVRVREGELLDGKAGGISYQTVLP